MNILLVEDSKANQLLVQEAFKMALMQCRIDIVEDGAEALQYLKREAPYKKALPPDIIILDLNLPKKNGRQVLAELKKDEALNHIPVVILSNSRSPKDVLACYKLQASCYLSRPDRFSELVETARSFKDFWGSKVLLSAHSKNTHVN